ASSSGISVSKSSSRAMTSSTVSSESAPRSSTNEDSFLISASLTPSCSATIFLTRCSTFSMRLLPRGVSNVYKADGFYQMSAICADQRPWREAPSARFARVSCAARDRASRHIHAAVHVQRRPCDVSGLGRRKKSDGVGDVVRRAQSAQWYSLDQLLPLRIRHRARHVGIDEAGCNAVHGDFTAADLLRKRLGKT